jgi:hypothetical protein
MKLGSFEVPEKRLVPDAMTDIKKIYDAIASDEISSKDLSTMFGYKYPTATPFYMRLNSMVSYGLLEGRGTFKVSELGKSLSYPENERQEKILKARAILSIPLWRELYKKIGKTPPVENFWVQIKSITGVEPQEARKVETLIRKWYTEDILHISEDISSEISEEKTEGLRANEPNTKQMSQQLVVPADPNSFGILSVKGIGNIDLTDEDSIDLAESALKILRKKLPTMTSKSPPAEPPQE